MRMWNTYYGDDCVYHPWWILRGAEEKLDLYIAQCWYILPDEFFEYITSLISEYDSFTRNGERYYEVTQSNPIKDKNAAIIFSQIRAAQANPIVLKDPRGMKIYEALANKKSENCFHLYDDTSFVDANVISQYSKSGQYTGCKVNGIFPLAWIWPEHNSISVNNSKKW